MKIGMRHAAETVVTDQMTAAAMKSGLVPVLATPLLIALIEDTCLECVAPALETGQTTVGTQVNVTHEAATPVGMKVRCTCELIEIDRRRLVYRVEAQDACGLISRGTHERFIVDMEQFIAKAAAKGQNEA